MNATRTYVADFCRVLLVEYALHSQCPGFRVRKLLNCRKEVGRGGALISNGGECVQARTTSGRQAPIRQESTRCPDATTRAIHALVHIAGAAKLRRNSQEAKIVI